MIVIQRSVMNIFFVKNGILFYGITPHLSKRDILNVIAAVTNTLCDRGFPFFQATEESHNIGQSLLF